MKVKNLKDGNWGLKLLALVLAIVIYHTLKPQTDSHRTKEHDRSIFQPN